MAKNHRDKRSPILDQKTKTEKEKALPGYPGYRTREGRSGYDYVDTQTEFAHMQGVFLRRFFTISLNTRNPLILFFLFVLGLFFLFPIVFSITELVNGNPLDWITNVISVIVCIPGFIAMANVIRNLFRKE